MSTLPTKLQRVVDRLTELAAEGRRVATLPKEGYMGKHIQGGDKAYVEAWLTKSENLIQGTFGERSAHQRRFHELAKKQVSHDYEIYPIVGVIEACIDDLQHGFLTSQQFLIAGELFDSVLSEAKHLASCSYKDPAAILARVVLEDALKRIAQECDINGNTKASIINDELKRSGRFSQPLWRQVQSWLDLGNAAAHGKFTEYSDQDVNRCIEGIEMFVATEFHT